MNTLFRIEPDFPAGFSYNPGFISREEESSLLKIISGIQLKTFNFHGYEAKRNVASFGAGWSFTNRSITEGQAIPAEFNWLVQKIADQLSIEAASFSQLLVTQYPVGSVINWHRDAPAYDIIAGVSLLSECTFRLRPCQKEKQGRRSIISFTVEPGSLYVMKGESRSEWEHSTAPVKSIRYSITLRTLKNRFP